MTRKLLISLLVIAVMSLMVGQGVVSFMSDTETSAGNTFTAGTIDLQVDDQDHPPALIELPDLKPCQESWDIYIPYSNVGTNPGTVTLEVWYEESDNEELDTDPGFEFSAGPPEDPWAPGYEVSADDFAKKVYISKAKAHLDGGVVDLMPTLLLYAEGVFPVDGGAYVDGQVSIYEFAWQEAPWDGYNIPRVWPLAEVLQPGASETLVLRFHLDGMAGNEYQADGIVSTLDFEMMQLRRDPNLVMDLQFNEGAGTTAHDASSHGNHGAIVDNEGDQWTSDPPYVGYGVDFDGTDDYVQVSDSPSLQITDALTMEAWLNLTPRADGNDQSLLMKGAYDWYLGVWGTERTPSGLVEFFAGDDMGGWHGLAGSTPVDDETWHHVVLTYDGSNIRLYVDGTLDAETMGDSFTFKTSTDSLLISKAGGRWVQGDVDRVRVYNRALGPEEVFYSYLVSYSHYHGGP